MSDELIERVRSVVRNTSAWASMGRVSDLSGGTVAIAGLEGARLGDRVEVLSTRPRWFGEIVSVGRINVRAVIEGSGDGIAMNDQVRLANPPVFAPDDSWIGRVIDPDGKPMDGRPILPGLTSRDLRAAPPSAETRKGFGDRLATGFTAFDTLLPLARGQRLGLFAGSGVGKSTLLGGLAQKVQADVIVIGLVGERGRELRDFIDKVLGPEGLARSVVVAATSDRAPQVRRRCAWSAMAVAEHFRDRGKQVLLLMDSVTRFAEAHRELAVAGREMANLRGFPPSTGPTLAALCERAGPGADGTGDITAIFSVLVAGSDMEEPVADMLRGVLDGHIVLDRQIAERGRFPAIDLLRSTSRSLPEAASDEENGLINDARRILGTYDRSELMIQAGLYNAGNDPKVDEAIALFPALDNFISEREPRGISASFATLRRLLGSRPQARA